MKKRFVMAVIAATLVLGGCAGKTDAPSEGSALFEKVDENGQSETENNGSADSAAEGEGAAEKSETGESSADSEDYTEQIKAEIAAITSGSESLSKELVSVNELYNKYDELRMNAPDQTSINELSKWGTVVWKEETLSLLDRLKQNDPDNYDDLYAEHQKWESYVPSMAEKMSYMYAEGSIYPTIYAYNEAMRYKREAYVLSSTLADIINDVAFGFPDSTPCGFYGDYASDSYLIITEGMESDSYDILIHFDDSKELRGWGTVEDAPDAETYLLFTSEDDTVKGYVSHSALEASFYVTETDNSVVGPEGAWTFTFKY